MKKISAVIAAILCLSSYPAFSADSLPAPAAYLAIVELGGRNAVPPPGTPVKPYLEVVCEIAPITVEARNKIGEIWNKFAPKFDYKNWEYAVPDASHDKITIYYNGHTLTFILVQGLKERIAADAELNKKAAAFNDIMKECKGWKPHAIP